MQCLYNISQVVHLPTNLATMIEGNRVLRDDSMARSPGATQQCFINSEKYFRRLA